MKRFYKQVSTEPAGEGWQVHLDGRGVKTVKGSPQIAPSKALAEALAHGASRVSCGGVTGSRHGLTWKAMSLSR